MTDFIWARSAALIAAFADKHRTKKSISVIQRKALLGKMRSAYDRKVAQAMFKLISGEKLGNTGPEDAAKILMGWCRKSNK